MRIAKITRNTAETNIELEINIDGTGTSKIDTGCAFLNHMLTLFSKHGKFDLSVYCDGDIDVDAHHTTEDVGICLGRAIAEAIGDKAGIERYAHTILPMDEALILSAVDFSGRGYFAYELDIKRDKVGDFDTELCAEFWQAFATNAGATLHLRQMAGNNAHHIIEGTFKSCAVSIRRALTVDERFKNDIPSTKGVL